MPVILKDQQKRGKDLQTKDFPENGKVELKGSNGNFSFESNVNVKEGKYAAQFTPKQRLPDVFNSEVKLDFTTEGKMRVDVAIADELAKGLKTTISVEQNGSNNFGVFAAEFKNENVAFTLDVEGGKENNAIASTLVVAQQGYVGGFGVDAYLNQTLKGYRGLVGYTSSDIDFNAFYNKTNAVAEDKKSKKLDEVGLQVYHKVNTNLQYAFEVSKDLAENGKVKMSGALQYAPTSTTNSKIYVDTNGDVKVSYIQQLDKNVKVSVGNKVNLDAPSKNSLGFGITFNY